MTGLFSKKINIRAYSISILSIFIITGCNDNSVNTVKGSINYSINDTLTIGKALDSRTDCINGKWDSSKDSRDRVIVTYSCELPQNYLDLYMSIREQNNIKALNDNIGANSNEIEEYQRELNQWNQEKRILDKVFTPLVNNHANELKQLSQFSSLRNLGELSLTFEDWRVENVSSDIFCSYYKNAEPDVKNQCAEWYSAYKIKQSLLGEFMKLSNNSSIDEEKASFAEGEFSNILNNMRTNGNGIEYINDYIKSSDKGVSDNINDSTNRINQRLKNIERDKNDLTKVKDNIHVDKVSERFSWYVLDNKSIQEIDAEFTIKRNGENIQVPVSDSFDRYLSFAYHDFSDNVIPNAYVDIINNAFHPNN